MNPTLNINVIYLMRYLRDGDYTTISKRYPGANQTDATNQANYLTAVHGYVH